MSTVRKHDTTQLYARHAAAGERGKWSALNDVRWGDIDARRAGAQPEVLAELRRLTLGLARRGASAARLIAGFAHEPHASAALTLELWDGLKHMHVLRSYLDTVDSGPRISDEEIAAARSAPGVPAQAANGGPSTFGAAELLDLLRVQHIASTTLRQIGSRAEEPVLAEIMSFMAADEARRAQITADLLTLRLRTGGCTVAEVRGALQGLRDRARAGGVTDDLAMQTYVRRVEALCAELSPG